MTEEFTRGDKFIWWFSLCYSIFFCLYSLVFTLVYLKVKFSERVWRNIQAFKIWSLIIMFGPMAIWLTIYGCRDFINFFTLLKETKRDELDDGTVFEHYNLADEAAVSNLDNNKQNLTGTVDNPEII